MVILQTSIIIINIMIINRNPTTPSFGLAQQKVNINWHTPYNQTESTVKISTVSIDGGLHGERDFMGLRQQWHTMAIKHLCHKHQIVIPQMEESNNEGVYFQQKFFACLKSRTEAKSTFGGPLLYKRKSALVKFELVVFYSILG